MSEEILPQSFGFELRALVEDNVTDDGAAAAVVEVVVVVVGEERGTGEEKGAWAKARTGSMAEVVTEMEEE